MIPAKPLIAIREAIRTGYAILLKEQESDYETAMEYVAELKVEVETKRSLIAELQAGLDQAELDGRQGGLEAAALYHDGQAIICEALSRDYTIESAKHKDDALTSRKHAAAIRALKEPTP